MKIYITNLFDAQQIITSHDKEIIITNAGLIINTKVTHIVSIGANISWQRPPAQFDIHPATKLRLEFFDISCEKRDDMNGPSGQDMEKLIDFYQTALQIKHPSFLIHCFAGQSRSVGAGLILLYMINKDWEVAWQELYKIIPQAKPNIRMINLAKEIFEGQI